LCAPCTSSSARRVRSSLVADFGADFIKLKASEAESPWIAGFGDPAEYPALVAGLRERGYDRERLDAILSDNWVRILRETLADPA
jgi:microsomal dipeptidase-like Zn-dependent dipeptidase